MNDRTLAAYNKWISTSGLPDNKKSVNKFYRHFIGVFYSYEEFYAHIYGLPKTFFVLSEQEVIDFDKFYYTLGVIVQVEPGEPFDCQNARTNEFSGYRTAFFKRL